MTSTRLVWGHRALTLELDIDPQMPARLVEFTASDASAGHPRQPSAAPIPSQPLVEVWRAGEGSLWSGPRIIDTGVGSRLRCTGYLEHEADGWVHLAVDQVDREAGLTVRTCFRSPHGVAAMQAWTVVRAVGPEPVTLHAVTSLVTGAFSLRQGLADDVDVLLAESDWLAESRWKRWPLRRLRLPDIDLEAHGKPPRGALVVVSHGAWSTGAYLPTGLLEDRVRGRAWAWQVEHNGAWRWEVGERLDGIYVAALGPTDSDHQWRHTLEPGMEFTTVPVGFAVGDDGFESAIGALTSYRRALVHPHPDRDRLPVIFNDYMNTLNGDPSTEALLPLVDAAGGVGAECFVVDAGWYDDDGTWWDSVGEWRPSRTRFPHGLEEVVERIRKAGMRPGLWLEPEVVGVRNPLAHSLPAGAFFQRDGHRHIEHGRYHLDLRHTEAVTHLDATIDRLVDELGISYFKLDYNIDPGPGTDSKSFSPGDGLLAHNRAHLAWLDAVLERHPEMVLENCGSGAMRMDYALLSRLQLQSTSDQQNPLRYPPIAAAAPMSVLPEQSASWAYPQPEMSAEEIAFTMCTAMLGRLYLSGHIDRMEAQQLQLVAEGVQAHKAIRADLAAATPLWPLGLPAWEDQWLALGMQTPECTYLTVWRRPSDSPNTANSADMVALPVRQLAETLVDVEVLYPRALTPWPCAWNGDTGVLQVTGTQPPSARLMRLRPSAPTQKLPRESEV